MSEVEDAVQRLPRRLGAGSRELRIEEVTMKVQDYERASRGLIISGYAESRRDRDGDEWLVITRSGVEKMQAG